MKKRKNVMIISLVIAAALFAWGIGQAFGATADQLPEQRTKTRLTLQRNITIQ